MYLNHNFFIFKNYIICLDVAIPSLEPKISVTQNYNSESSNYEQGVEVNMVDSDIVINENYNILPSTSDQSKI